MRQRLDAIADPHARWWREDVDSGDPQRIERAVRRLNLFYPEDEGGRRRGAAGAAQHILAHEAREDGLWVALRGHERPVVVPWTFTERLAGASAEQRARIELLGDHGFHWPDVDEHLHIDSLFAWAMAPDDGSGTQPYFGHGEVHGGSHQAHRGGT